jgi:hypothetical protein
MMSPHEAPTPGTREHFLQVTTFGSGTPSASSPWCSRTAPGGFLLGDDQYFVIRVKATHSSVSHPVSPTMSQASRRLLGSLASIRKVFI